MKRLLLVSAAILVLGTPIAQAQMESEEEWLRHMQKWQERTKTMHEQMNKIAATKDPEERRRLLEEHWRTMSEQMDDVNMMSGHMMGGQMKGAGMMGRGMMGGHMMRPGMMGGHMMHPGMMGGHMMHPGMMGGHMMGPGMMGHGMMGGHMMHPGMMGGMGSCMMGRGMMGPGMMNAPMASMAEEMMRKHIEEMHGGGHGEVPHGRMHHSE
jgi:Ni/Co efflux regulator RcnB